MNLFKDSYIHDISQSQVLFSHLPKKQNNHKSGLAKGVNNGKTAIQK